MMIAALHPDQAPDFEELLAPLIAPAIAYDHNDLTVEEVIDRLAADRMRGLVVLDDDNQAIAFQTMELVHQ